MDDPRPGGLSAVACRGCELRIPVTTAVVHMGAVDLFACPACNHQEVWRDPVPVSATTHAWSTRGAL